MQRSDPARLQEALAEARERIDVLNGQILALVSERARIALDISVLKNGLGRAAVDPQRESEELRRILGSNPGPLSDEAVGHLFREIFGATRQLLGATRSA